MKKAFNPLLFLASLGAGGISILPFSVLQYTVPHGKGLISISHMLGMGFSTAQWIYFGILFVIMIAFGILHVVLTVIFAKKFFPWLKSEAGKLYINNPLKNAGIMTPLISILMTMNVVIGTVRFFIPWLSDNLQTVMLPALICRLLLWGLTMGVTISMLKKTFLKGFDMSKITFGRLLYPFALGMLSVVGAGIAALAHNADIASTGAFFALISATMGMFLFALKLISLFKKHFVAREGLGDKHAMPSFLIVLPNITLYAITFFRLTHYLGHQLGVDLHWLGFIVIMTSFAFSIRYLLFGIVLMKEYFRDHFFKKEFYVTQWGLICPGVAFTVLSAFAYAQFFQYKAIYGLIVLFTIITVGTYLFILRRHISCAGKNKKAINCE